MSISNNLQIATLSYQQALKVELTQIENDITNIWGGLKAAKEHGKVWERKMKELTETIITILNKGLQHNCTEIAWQSVPILFSRLTEVRATNLESIKYQEKLQIFYNAAKEKYTLIQSLLNTSTASLQNGPGHIIYVPVQVPPNFIMNNGSAALNNNQSVNVSIPHAAPVVGIRDNLSIPNSANPNAEPQKRKRPPLKNSAFHLVNPTSQNSSSNHNNPPSQNQTPARGVEDRSSQKKPKTDEKY